MHAAIQLQNTKQSFFDGMRMYKRKPGFQTSWFFLWVLREREGEQVQRKRRGEVGSLMINW